MPTFFWVCRPAGASPSAELLLKQEITTPCFFHALFRERVVFIAHHSRRMGWDGMGSCAFAFLSCHQVLEAKTNASSLTAKLADTEAELRASTSRVEDVSAKVFRY